MPAPRFKRGFENILYTRPWLRRRLGDSVRTALRLRVARGLAIGPRRRGEMRVGEPRFRGTHASPSTRRYAGLDEIGQQVLKMGLEAARLRDIQRMTANKGDPWPISTIWKFLARTKMRSG